MLSRREFIGTSAILCLIPTRVFAYREETVTLRFAVMSDVHYPGNASAQEVKRFRKSLDFMYEYSNGKKYSAFDALVVAGDMTNNGTKNQIEPFKNDLDNGIKPGTKAVLCMGNHEFYGGSKPLWEETFGVSANTHTVINGFHFIALSPEKGSMRDGDYLYAKNWLIAELDKAVADDPKKPVFLIHHYHISETVYGSIKGDNWGIKDLFEILKKYPRVVDFSGHSHYPITDPRSAWQGEFSAFGTGTLSYFEMTSGKYDKFPPGHRNVGQFYIVEVHNDNSIILKPYDLISDSFYDMVYTIAEPGNISKYLYTDKRYETAEKPKWKPNTKLELENLDPFGGTFKFLQATDEITVHSYRMTFRRKERDEWLSDIEHYAWSNYFYKPMPEMMEVPFHQLDPETEYKLSITALNCFGKESETAIETFFFTPKDPNDTEDRNAEFPRANVLDVHFTSEGAINAPKNNEKNRKPIVTFGRPKIVEDKENGFHYAEFDGDKDALKIKFTDNDYSRLKRRITMAVQFRIEEFNEKKNASDLFANTENGGYCFELNHRKKTLEFWCHINGRYVIVSHPVSVGEYHTAFGVYDGRKVALHLDGKPVAETQASGMITYPGIDAAKAFCIGADINSSGGASSNFEGKIVFARVYAWALSPSQIVNLSHYTSPH